MLHKTLTYITGQLNEYLRLRFRLTNDIAFLAPPKESGNAISSNRVGISMVGVERETGAGISFNRQQVSDGQSKRSAPGWQLNIFILFAAVFRDKQYEESLQILSGILSFIQKNNVITIQESGITFSIEPVNLSFHEQSNLWGICGGTYYPSIICKLRMLTVDEQEILDLSSVIGNEELTIDS